MKEDIGKKFFDDKELRDLLKRRNNSILAHGTEPIDKETASKLLNKVEEYVKTVIKDYDNFIIYSAYPKFE